MFTTSLSSRRVLGAAAAACAAIALPSAANASTATSTLSVNATVVANCTVSPSALGFGNVDTLSGSNVDGAGGLSVTCTNGTTWTASAGVGAGTGATFLSRRMTAGANLLTYNLYTTSGRTVVWGDGTGATATLAGTGTGSVQSVSVYGRVGLGQTTVPAGSYADTVAVTITY
jgi:spore coat protein U-like protein